MKQIHYIANAYAEKQEADFKKADTIAYIQGIYVMSALKATVINYLGGKNARYEYPEQAYSLNDANRKLTEDEIEQQRLQFIAALQVMERNFKLKKEQEKGSE